MDNKIFLLALTYLLTSSIVAMEKGAFLESSLKRLKLEEGVVSHDKPEMITVKFSDDDMGIDINRLILEESKTIKDLLEDIETNELFFGGTPITQERFNVVLPLMEQLNANQSDVIKKGLNSKNITELSNLWDILNYLDVPDVLKLVNTDLSQKLFAQVKNSSQAIPELLQGIPDQFKRIKLSFAQLESVLPDEIKKKLINRLSYLERRFGPVIYSVAFDSVQSLLAIASSSNILIYNVSDKNKIFAEPPTILKSEGVEPDEVRSVAFDPTHHLLAAGRWFSGVIYDTSFPNNMSKIIRLEKNVAINSVAFDPAHNLFATGSNKTVNIYDVSDKNNIKLIKSLTDHTGRVRSVAFDPAHNLLATGSDTVNIYDVSDKNNIKLIKSLTDHTGTVRSVAFDPAHNLFATGSDTVNIYDVSDKNNIKLIKSLTDHTGSVLSVAFDPAHNLLATGSEDKTVNIYDVSDKNNIKLIKSLTDHTDSVRPVAFDPAHNLLATASVDTVNIYDLRLLNIFKNLTVGQALAVIYIVQIKPTRMSDISKDIEQQFDLLDEPVKQLIYDYIEKEARNE